MGFAEERQTSVFFGSTWACFLAASYAGVPAAAPSGAFTSTLPPWQSMQPSFTVVAVCMLGESVLVWHVTQPVLLRSASACPCLAISDFSGSGFSGSAGAGAGVSSSLGPRRMRCASRTGLVSPAAATPMPSTRGRTPVLRPGSGSKAPSTSAAASAAKSPRRHPDRPRVLTVAPPTASPSPVRACRSDTRIPTSTGSSR